MYFSFDEFIPQLHNITDAESHHGEGFVRACTCPPWRSCCWGKRSKWLVLVGYIWYTLTTDSRVSFCIFWYLRGNLHWSNSTHTDVIPAAARVQIHVTYCGPWGYIRHFNAFKKGCFEVFDSANLEISGISFEIAAASFVADSIYLCPDGKCVIFVAMILQKYSNSLLSVVLINLSLNRNTHTKI